jgi:hypothetical protein
MSCHDDIKRMLESLSDGFREHNIVTAYDAQELSFALDDFAQTYLNEPFSSLCIRSSLALKEYAEDLSQRPTLDSSKVVIEADRDLVEALRYAQRECRVYLEACPHADEAHPTEAQYLADRVAAHCERTLAKIGGEA